MSYIGITEDRLRHMLGVARKAYEIAKNRTHDEDFCRKMFAIGLLHDIGYEFAETQEEHTEIGANIVSLLIDNESDQNNNNTINELRKHGLYADTKNEEWIILNMADMLVDPEGKAVSVTQRLNDIKERYGERSNQYLTACDICYQIGLTAVNLSSNIIP